MHGSKGRRGGINIFELMKSMILIVMVAAVGFAAFILQSASKSLRGLVARDVAAEDHDLTIENNGIFGYMAADFQDAILGDSEQFKKLEVYQINMSDAVQLMDTGLANLNIFPKTQILTFKGTATYTVD